MTVLSISSTVTLKHGGKMPRLGFGVALSNDTHKAVTAALADGYRMIDSARLYGNEAEVAEAAASWLKEGGDGPVWLTSKIKGEEQVEGKCEAAIDESIKKLEPLGLKWDLFLLHDATAGKENRIAAWKVLEAKQKVGLIKEIGVSSFSAKHLEEFKKAGLSTPSVNQIELHPFNQQRPIVKYCKEEGIIVQAFCPLIRGRKMDHPVIQQVSKDSGKSPAQVLVRWALQKGYVPLPKSDTPSRIAENADVFDFELSDEAMTRLDGLDEGAVGACSWNPVNVD